jgi:circadian clock protein KaiB
MKQSHSIGGGATEVEAPLAAAGEAHFRLQLFVSGSTPRSSRAIRNIRALCEENLAGRYDLEVIDIYQHPERVKPERIVVTPTLVKKLPLPFRKIVGDLAGKERVLAGLDIMAMDASMKLQALKARALKPQRGVRGG